MASKNNRKYYIAELRERAEAVLSQHASQLTPNETNLQQLIHELQIHQTELEIQNEDLKASQIALEQSRDAYRDLFDFAPMGYFTLDSSNIVMEANITGANMLKGTPDAFAKQPFTKCINKESQDRFYLYLRAVDEGGAGTCDIQMVGEDGSQIEVQLKCVKIKSNDSTSGSLRVTLQDITKRKQAEQRAKLHEARLRGVIQDLPYGIVLVDQEHRVLLANPVGQNYLATLATVGDDDRVTKVGNKPLDDILSSYSEPQQESTATIEISIESAPPRLFEIQVLSIDQNGGQWGLFIRETTLLRQMEKRNQKQEQLATVGQFAAGLAHDFNNVIQIVLSSAQLIQGTQDDLLPANQQHLRNIVVQCNRTARSVRQILDFSQKSSTAKKTMDLGDLLGETIKLMAGVLPDAITLNFTIDPKYNTYLISADAAQIEQVLLNLTFNARDAALGAGTVDYYLSKQDLQSDEHLPAPEMTPGSWIVLTVSDSGPGISMENIHKIFDPFFTTKEVGKGSGLGLAQVHGIIGQHNGVIVAESPAVGGANFTMYLPEIDGELSPSLSSTSVDALHGQGETILLVEDEPAVANALEMVIKGFGFAVVTAVNGKEALLMLARYKAEIRLVITDIVMPVMDGLSLANAIAELDPTLPVIALSGHPIKMDNPTAISPAIVEWLAKPVSFDSLAHAINRHLVS